jgi:hypothetical protein
VALGLIGSIGTTEAALLLVVALVIGVVVAFVRRMWIVAGKVSEGRSRR